MKELYEDKTLTEKTIDRRTFIKVAGSLVSTGILSGCSDKESEKPDKPEKESKVPFFKIRGIVLSPDDLTLTDLPERVKAAGLTTIGLHPNDIREMITNFVKTDKGMEFFEKCKRLGIEIEYELHATSMLLPRELFEKEPGMFRMNEEGERTADFNLCVHSKGALETVCENAVEISKVLTPTTGRYFYWIDDNKPMCRCNKCNELSDSDQAAIVENNIIKSLRQINPDAQLAHLSYSNTLQPPEKIKPEEGVFLEFAPIGARSSSQFLVSKSDPLWDKEIEALDKNLEVFPAETAQVLEYWLDVSMWTRNYLSKKGFDYSRLSKKEIRSYKVKIPWDKEVFNTDINLYGSKGIRNITTFGIYIDKDYVFKFGEPPIEQYGKSLLNWQPI